MPFILSYIEFIPMMLYTIKNTLMAKHTTETTAMLHCRIVKPQYLFWLNEFFLKNKTVKTREAINGIINIIAERIVAKGKFLFPNSIVE